MKLNNVNGFEELGDLVNGFEPDTNEKFDVEYEDTIDDVLEDIEDIKIPSISTPKKVVKLSKQDIENVEVNEENTNKIGRPLLSREKRKDEKPISVYCKPQTKRFLNRLRKHDDRPVSYVRNQILEIRVEKLMKEMEEN